MTQESQDTTRQSDKIFWHRYEPFYLSLFNSLPTNPNILEFGTYKGDSVRWLRSRFPHSTIVSADILPVQESWPADENIFYVTLDQGSRTSIKSALEQSGLKYDLIIEDGSHVPSHQRNSLLECLEYLTAGGVFVVEDIHTSSAALRKRKLFQRTTRIWPGTLFKLILRRAMNRFSAPKGEQSYNTSDSQFSGSRFFPRWRNRFGTVNVLSLLLALERRTSQGQTLSAEEKVQLSFGGFFSSEDIALLESRVENIQFFRRMSLPFSCYKCLGDQFDLVMLRCPCGVPLYTDDDSMVAAVGMKNSE